MEYVAALKRCNSRSENNSAVKTSHEKFKRPSRSEFGPPSLLFPPSELTPSWRDEVMSDKERIKGGRNGRERYQCCETYRVWTVMLASAVHSGAHCIHAWVAQQGQRPDGGDGRRRRVVVVVGGGGSEGHTRTRAGGRGETKGWTSVSHDNCNLCYGSRVAKSFATGMMYTPFI